MDRLRHHTPGGKRCRNDHACDGPAGNRFDPEHEERVGQNEDRQRCQTAGDEREAKDAAKLTR